MLSIGTVSAGNQAQREYHERQLAQSRDDYYREQEGPAGVWVGARAEALGLSGEVDVEAFRRMLDGQNPATGEDLGGRMDRRKTVAFDLAFSAPKSVSLLRMAADPATAKAIDGAHERAVLAALRYVEQEGWKGRARVTREDGSRDRVTVDGTGVVGVLYRHETTRNADPQLHSHAVLANTVTPAEGDVQAINSPVLYQQAKTAGSVYQAVLRGELGRQLGIQFDRPVNGLADIKGFSRQLIETFSTRRAEILEALKSRGLSPASKLSAERAALESRRAKDMGLDHAAWRGEVREVLARDGFGMEQAQAFVRAPAERELAGVGAGSGDQEQPVARSVGDRLADAPLHLVTSQRATEDARGVRQAALSIAEGYTANEVHDAMRGALVDPRIVQVSAGERPQFTTERHLQIEERVQETALGRMSDTSGPRIAADSYEVPTVTPDGHALSTEQKRVLEQVLTSGHGVEVIRARAGAGKTTIAGLAKTEFEQHGIRVVGVAPTLQALAELDDVGLDERDSLARTAFSDGEFSKVMRTMDHRTVVLVDEAAMAETRQIAPLLDRAAERGAKVVAIGDDVQLSAVGAGGWFRYLTEHQDSTVLELTEVHRQRDPVERDRLNQLHRGDVSGWVRWADQHDRIHIQPSVEDAYVDAVDRYEQVLGDVDGDVDRIVVMAPENTHRRALNEQLRRVVADHGIVDRGREREYGGLLVAPGDRLVATSTVAIEGTSRRLVENGERFEVTGVGRAGVTATAVAGKRRGETVRLPAHVLEPGSDGARAVEHGYARTVHKAQGMTVDRSILFAPDPGRLGRNLAYVGLTRTRDRADLVTVAAEGRPAGLERLARGMAERRDDEAALAIADPSKLDRERIGRMSDPEIDEHRHTLLTEAREAMVRLTRLDREARGAWAGSGDARTDVQLLAERDQLAARVDDAARLLAEHDPTGDRADRGLMEHTTRQGLERDREQLQRLDDRLAGRNLVDIDEADDTQQRIRAERGGVERYLDGLLAALDRVHGQQIDRSTTPTDPTSVPESERPALALRDMHRRQERVRDLTVAAAQQLGAGHPTVGRWLDRHVQAPAPGPADRAARPQKPAVVLTPHQQAFADALRGWKDAVGRYVDAGGRRELNALTDLVDQLQIADRDHDKAIAALASHQEQKPPQRRKDQYATWARMNTTLETVVEQTAAAAKGVGNERDAVEERYGRPLGDVVADLSGRRTTSEDRSRAATDAERQLRVAGPAGVGPKTAQRHLGRRDELQPGQQRRYDDLAGRMAVEHVLAREPAAKGWRPMQPTQTMPAVASWRQERGLPLTDRQQQIVDQAPDRGVDRGPDLGR